MGRCFGQLERADSPYEAADRATSILEESRGKHFGKAIRLQDTFKDLFRLREGWNVGQSLCDSRLDSCTASEKHAEIGWLAAS